MPTRMIREALLASDRFLNLPDNTARMCYVAALLTADDRGNVEASTGQLVRMWRDFGVDSNAKASAIAGFLADQDLIRLYQADGKQYLHIPRFGQRLRHLNRACPPSPWCDNKEKQGPSLGNVRRPSDDRQTTVRRPTAEVKRSEEKRREESKGRALALPDWLPLPAWQAWIEVRSRIKAPNTDAALTLNLRKLEKLRSEGQDPKVVLEQSVERGWRGLFPVKAEAVETSDWRKGLNLA